MDKKTDNLQANSPLLEEVRQLVQDGAALAEIRNTIADVLRKDFKAERASIEAALRAGRMSGLESTSALSDVMDGVLLSLLFVTTTEVFPPGNKTSGDALALVATGGYGRREMAFYSDVDILFLIPYKPTPWIENVTEFMLQVLWDLGLKVGHALRSVEGCISVAKDDLSVKTALLDRRFLGGDKGLFDKLEKKYKKEIVSGQGLKFVEAKLEERDRRHDRLMNSRYVVEPNVKEGKGGLRDLNTLMWITRFLYGASDMSGLVKKKILKPDEFSTFKRAENFLWTVRQHLHLLAGRPEERLTFDMQLRLSEELGYRDRPGVQKIERFMKHYYWTAKNVGDLTRIFCAVLEERHQKKGLFDWTPDFRKEKIEGFRLDNGRLNVPDEKAFKKKPSDMIRIFAVADRHGYDIHPDALGHISRNRNLINNRLRRDPDANDAFLEILTSRFDPETGLRRMNEAGVLGRFITDFGRIVAHSQHDMYHSFTVDEHTIRAVGFVSKLEKGDLDDVQTVAAKVVSHITDRRVLYMGIFLHDIAKGRGGDHSELGEKIAYALCPRLGFSSSETDTVAWLVRKHLLMSNTAFKFDITDPKTIKTFVDEVATLERLQLLAFLTVADIMAVGPKVWNSWKDRLLSDLYDVAKPWFTQESIEEARKTQNLEKQKALKKALKTWPMKKFNAVVALLPENYWLGDPTPIQARDAKLVARAAGGKTAVDIRLIEKENMARVGVISQAGFDVFTNLAGAIASHNISIIDARSFTLEDGRLLNSFVVENPPSDFFRSNEKQTALKKDLRAVAEGKLKDFKIPRAKGLLADKAAYFKVVPRVRIQNEVSADYTIVEVRTRDRVGLLYDLTKVMIGLGCAIFSAHVATFGARAADVFYIRDQKGEKIQDEKKLARLKEAVFEVIDPKPAAKGKVKQ